jgi:bifunctional oligoribonuclease and PAP phosphatase NrnA
VQKLIQKIKSANTILLSTHRQCDGDGLGAQLGLFHAFRKVNKKVRCLNVDATPKKYDYLNTAKHIQYYEGTHEPIEPTDLCLILDTNDKRLITPLYEELEIKCKVIAFIDHHPILDEGPAPTIDSLIDTKAASTGEIAFNIIKAMQIGFDAQIARALYTSIVFDTQLFRYVRNSPQSHLIAAELLSYEKDPGEVHKYLFANHKVEKFKFLASLLDQMVYFADQKLAILKIKQSDLTDHGMVPEDSRDIIDLIMNVESLTAAAVILETHNGHYKISIRSKGAFEVRAIAESFGGGGHMYAAGATVNLPYQKVHDIIVDQLTQLLKHSA